MRSTNPLHGDAEIEAIMDDLARVLVRHLGFLPDAVLILRADEVCGTMFASGPTVESPRQVMTEVLEQAMVQNRLMGTTAPRRL